MMAHTPGPWEAYFDSCAHCGGEWGVMGPPAGNHGQFANEADARLASAAPDLLDALKDAMGLMPDATEFQRERLRRASRAIAKAEGRD